MGKDKDKDNQKDKDARWDRVHGFLTKFNESDTAAQLPFELKKQAFLDKEHGEAEKDNK